MRKNRCQGYHMGLEPANEGQTMIELIAIANIVFTLALLLWKE